MIDVIQSDTFRRWIAALQDQRAVARINARVRRLSEGNAGDVRPVGEGLSELRIDYGAGYRVYFVLRGPLVIVLLAGGDKRTQAADIKRARKIAQEWED